MFLAYKSAAQVTVANVATTVQLDAEKFDPSNSFNPAVSQFTTPVTGYSAFTGRADVIIDEPSAQMVPILLVNGAQACFGSEINFTSQAVTGSPLACMLRLNAGDIVSLTLYTTQVDPYQTGSQHTWLSGYLVAPA